MNLGLIGVICATFFLRINCDNDSSEMAQMKIKIDAMEKRLAKMDAMEKRLAKMDAMEKNQKDMQKSLLALQQQLDSTSLFSAQLSRDTEVAHGGTVLFDNVVVNYGSDYIQTGGIYIAPVDGHYMFTLVIREDGNTNCAGSVMRTLASDPNDAIVLCRAEHGNDSWQTGTCTVITQLLVGDQVYVIADGFIVDSENSFYMARGYTSLTGLIIKSGLE